MNAMGYVTVCLPNGSNSTWEQGYTALFSDKRVFLLGDNDNAGRKYLTRCAENIAETAQEIHVCEVSKLWDKLPDKGDITDIAETIGRDETNRRLIEHCKTVPVYVPKGSTVLLKNVTETPINWLWYPYIARGELTLLVGSGGFGKTTVAVDLAAKFSMGFGFPTQHEKNFTEKGKTLFISAEESLQNTIVLRFRLAGADLSKIEAVDFNEQELFTFTDEAVERAIRRSRAKLVIFDPLAAFLGSGRDTNKFNEIRPVFTHLRKIAEKYDCAIVIIAHLSKVQGMTAQDRVSGSTDIVNACRSVIGVGYVPKNNNEEADEDARVFTHIKSNLAKHGENILFRWVDDFKIEWQGEVTERYTPDEIMNAREFKRDVGRPKDQLTIAEELIRKFLEENNGEMPSADLERKVLLEGIGQRTYKTARKKLPLKTYAKGAREERIWYTILIDYQLNFS